MTRYSLVMLRALLGNDKLSDETMAYYDSIEGTFDIVKRVHVATGHGG